jgi:hypothetical protein
MQEEITTTPDNFDGELDSKNNGGETQKSDKLAPSIERANNIQRYIVTRNGQMVEVTFDQMTQEEKSVFDDSPELVQFDQDPLMNPSGFFDYLKVKNPNYKYDDLTSPEMIRKAVEWAQEKGFDPSELSPAQILLSQDYTPGTKTKAEIAQEVIEERVERLLSKKKELAHILVPTGNRYFHATPDLDTVRAIFKEGLYCDSRLGLDGSAVPLASLPADSGDASRDMILNLNVRKLAEPHRGHRYEVIIDLPSLTSQQMADYESRAANGENVSTSSYFVETRDHEVGGEGAVITYDATLPPKYLKGYIDLNTGEYYLKE